MSAISLMFDTLSMERLKLSAVVISLFHGPFSAPTAAKVLGYCSVRGSCSQPNNFCC